MIELMTIGYEGLTLPSFLAILKRCGVQAIVDVRELPFSRKPGFAKAPLAEALMENGVKYFPFPSLGCPKEIRYPYREDGDWNQYTLRFKTFLKTQNEALSSLASLIHQEERCCLLCFERDFNFCHRTYVAEGVVSFLNDSVRIQHLTGPIRGRVVVHELVVA